MPVPDTTKRTPPENIVCSYIRLFTLRRPLVIVDVISSGCVSVNVGCQKFSHSMTCIASGCLGANVGFPILGYRW